MSASMWYWLLLFLWVIFGAWQGWTTPPPGRYPIVGWSIVLFLLFLLIGLQAFDRPIKG